MKQENRGGKRINAGYKGKYIEPTILISRRVPESKYKEIMEIVEEICKPLLKIKK